MKCFCSILVVFAAGLSLVEGAPAKGKATPRPKPAAAEASPAPASPSPAPEAPAAPKDPDAVKLAIAGDSTAANFGSETAIYHGWGEFLGQNFTDKVTVLDMAKKGRTAKSFIEDGGWKSVLRSKPDIVLIQFGQNELITMTSGTDVKEVVREYRRYLAAYIDTARKSGVTPVVLTPTCHLIFKNGGPYDELAPFVAACKDVADSRSAPCIDVHEATMKLFVALGPEKTLMLHAKVEDPVHFGRVGAWAIASVVAKELAVVDRRFADAAKKPEGPGEILMPPHLAPGQDPLAPPPN